MGKLESVTSLMASSEDSACPVCLLGICSSASLPCKHPTPRPVLKQPEEKQAPLPAVGSASGEKELACAVPRGSCWAGHPDSALVPIQLL